MRMNGGMQTSALSANFCPLCSKIVWVGYPRDEYYSHMTQKGNILLCDTKNNIERKRIKDEMWQKIMSIQEEVVYE